ncbi:hypothetical protein BESB_045710 [Besnoitia besnoiti]|uniref:CKK domain-containing protein n=1 Tax=Besnoitia besnoiti TaxID=94643 RepID=A0A2A9MET0_BESBE|nr:hypothetical protein BESB_045710 [Besnoitia besnoiti]PFH36379.1 hypothetical protein BESB_045710 [Besnoitia besnoiti]
MDAPLQQLIESMDFPTDGIMSDTDAESGSERLLNSAHLAPAWKPGILPGPFSNIERGRVIGRGLTSGRQEHPALGADRFRLSSLRPPFEPDGRSPVKDVCFPLRPGCRGLARAPDRQSDPLTCSSLGGDDSLDVFPEDSVRPHSALQNSSEFCTEAVRPGFLGSRPPEGSLDGGSPLFRASRNSGKNIPLPQTVEGTLPTNRSPGRGRLEENSPTWSLLQSPSPLAAALAAEKPGGCDTPSVTHNRPDSPLIKNTQCEGLRFIDGSKHLSDSFQPACEGASTTEVDIDRLLATTQTILDRSDIGRRPHFANNHLDGDSQRNDRWSAPASGLNFTAQKQAAEGNLVHLQHGITALEELVDETERKIEGLGRCSRKSEDDSGFSFSTEHPHSLERVLHRDAEALSRSAGEVAQYPPTNGLRLDECLEARGLLPESPSCRTRHLQISSLRPSAREAGFQRRVKADVGRESEGKLTLASLAEHDEQAPDRDTSPGQLLSLRAGGGPARLSRPVSGLRTTTSGCGVFQTVNFEPANAYLGKAGSALGLPGAAYCPGEWLQRAERPFSIRFGAGGDASNCSTSSSVRSPHFCASGEHLLGQEPVLRTHPQRLRPSRKQVSSAHSSFSCQPPLSPGRVLRDAARIDAASEKTRPFRSAVSQRERWIRKSQHGLPRCAAAHTGSVSLGTAACFDPPIRQHTPVSHAEERPTPASLQCRLPPSEASSARGGLGQREMSAIVAGRGRDFIRRSSASSDSAAVLDSTQQAEPELQARSPHDRCSQSARLNALFACDPARPLSESTRHAQRRPGRNGSTHWDADLRRARDAPLLKKSCNSMYLRHSAVADWTDTLSAASAIPPDGPWQPLATPLEGKSEPIQCPPVAGGMPARSAEDLDLRAFNRNAHIAGSHPMQSPVWSRPCPPPAAERVNTHFEPCCSKVSAELRTQGQRADALPALGGEVVFARGPSCCCGSAEEPRECLLKRDRAVQSSPELLSAAARWPPATAVSSCASDGLRHAAARKRAAEYCETGSSPVARPCTERQRSGDIDSFLNCDQSEKPQGNSAQRSTLPYFAAPSKTGDLGSSQRGPVVCETACSPLHTEQSAPSQPGSEKRVRLLSRSSGETSPADLGSATSSGEIHYGSQKPGHARQRSSRASHGGATDVATGTSPVRRRDVSAGGSPRDSSSDTSNRAAGLEDRSPAASGPLQRVRGDAFALPSVDASSEEDIGLAQVSPEDSGRPCPLAQPGGLDLADLCQQDVLRDLLCSEGSKLETTVLPTTQDVPHGAASSQGAADSRNACKHIILTLNEALQKIGGLRQAAAKPALPHDPQRLSREEGIENALSTVSSWLESPCALGSRAQHHRLANPRGRPRPAAQVTESSISRHHLSLELKEVQEMLLRLMEPDIETPPTKKTREKPGLPSDDAPFSPPTPGCGESEGLESTHLCRCRSAGPPAEALPASRACLQRRRTDAMSRPALPLAEDSLATGRHSLSIFESRVRGRRASIGGASPSSMRSQPHPHATRFQTLPLARASTSALGERRAEARAHGAGATGRNERSSSLRRARSLPPVAASHKARRQTSPEGPPQAARRPLPASGHASAPVQLSQAQQRSLKPADLPRTAPLHPGRSGVCGRVWRRLSSNDPTRQPPDCSVSTASTASEPVEAALWAAKSRRAGEKRKTERASLRTDECLLYCSRAPPQRAPSSLEVERQSDIPWPSRSEGKEGWGGGAEASVGGARVARRDQRGPSSSPKRGLRRRASGHRGRNEDWCLPGETASASDRLKPLPVTSRRSQLQLPPGQHAKSAPTGSVAPPASRPHRLLAAADLHPLPSSRRACPGARRALRQSLSCSARPGPRDPLCPHQGLVALQTPLPRGSSAQRWGRPASCGLPDSRTSPGRRHRLGEGTPPSLVRSAESLRGERQTPAAVEASLTRQTPNRAARERRSHSQQRTRAPCPGRQDPMDALSQRRPPEASTKSQRGVMPSQSRQRSFARVSQESERAALRASECAQRAPGVQIQLSTERACMEANERTAASRSLHTACQTSPLPQRDSGGKHAQAKPSGLPALEASAGGREGMAREGDPSSVEEGAAFCGSRDAYLSSAAGTHSSPFWQACEDGNPTGTAGPKQQAPPPHSRLLHVSPQCRSCVKTAEASADRKQPCAPENPAPGTDGLETRLERSAKDRLLDPKPCAFPVRSMRARVHASVKHRKSEEAAASLLPKGEQAEIWDDSSSLPGSASDSPARVACELLSQQEKEAREPAPRTHRQPPSSRNRRGASWTSSESPGRADESLFAWGRSGETRRAASACESDDRLGRSAASAFDSCACCGSTCSNAAADQASCQIERAAGSLSHSPQSAGGVQRIAEDSELEMQANECCLADPFLEGSRDQKFAKDRDGDTTTWEATTHSTDSVLEVDMRGALTPTKQRCARRQQDFADYLARRYGECRGAVAAESPFSSFGGSATPSCFQTLPTSRCCTRKLERGQPLGVFEVRCCGSPFSPLTEKSRSAQAVAKAFGCASNRAVILNALQHACLAGEVNRRRRERLIACFNEEWTERRVFIILLKGPGDRHELRALYALDARRGLVKVAQVSPAPSFLEDGMIEQVFRYDCATRRFRLVEGARTLSPLTAAVTLKRNLQPASVSQTAVHV